MMPTDYTIGQLYYVVVKKYELPVRNHLHVKKKIAELGREVSEAHAKHYLATLLRRDLRTETGEYKPVLAEALDIYTKRVKVERYLKDNKVVVPADTSKLAAEHEARRAHQFEED